MNSIAFYALLKKIKKISNYKLMELELIVRRTKFYLTTIVYNKIQLGCAVVSVVGVTQSI